MIVCGVVYMSARGWNISETSVFCGYGWDAIARSRRATWSTVLFNAWYCWHPGVRLRRTASVHLE